MYDQPITDPFKAPAVFAALQAAAAERGVFLRYPPTQPACCCNRGCPECVWKAYLEAAEYWRQEALLMMAD